MSSQEQRQDRNHDRATRGRGKPRGGYSSRGREHAGGHQKQPSIGYGTQYPTHNMYAPSGPYYMPANFVYGHQGQQQHQFGGVPQQFVSIPREEYQNPQAPQEPKAPLVKKAEPNKAVFDFKARIAAKLAEQGGKVNEFKPKEAGAKDETPAEKKPEPKPEPKAEPKVEPKSEPKTEAKADSKAKESKPETAKNDAAARMKALIEERMAQTTGGAKKDVPKEEPKEEPKVEPKEEPKEEKLKADVPKPEPVAETPKEEPKASESKSEPRPEVEKDGKHESEEAPTVEDAKPEAETEVAATPEAKEAESSEATESTETTELADSVSSLKIDGGDQTTSEPAAPEEPEDESFSEQIKSATKIASPKDQNYPEGITATSFEGFVYDTTFLKQFQTVVPAINRRALREIVNVEAQKGGRAMSNRGNRMGSQREGRNMSRHPSMASMHGKGRNNSRRKGDRQGSSRRDKDEPAVPVKPLVRGENAYVPRSLKVTDSGKVEAAAVDETPKPDLLPQEEVERRVKSLLNKMSLDNLDRIATKIIDIANQSKHEDDARTLQQIIGLTFDKACDEPHWSAMYAQFCIKLHGIDSEITDANTIGKDGKPVSGQHLFRRFMLSRCQKEFEQGWSSTQTEAAGDATDVMSDAYYAAVKAKRHGLGLVRFVGELFKNSFLQVKIISFCIQRLSRETPTEEIVESMCKLITTVAPRLQLESPAILGDALEQLKIWRGTEGFPSRLRFMIMDVEDAHRTGWKVEDEGPKTLAEVHKEVAEEQAAAESEKRSRGGGGFGGPSRRNERDSQRRLEKERQKFTNSARRTPASDSSLTPTASSTNLKKEQPAKNMFNAFNELS